MRSAMRTLDRGTLRDIALVCLADALVGASFGAIAVSGGLPAWVPVAMSLLVFAGGSQFAAVGVVLAGGGPIAAVVTGLVLNARLLPFGFAVADVLGGGWRAKLLGAQMLTDESAAFTLLQRDPKARRAAFWICGVALFAVWNLAVLLGAMAGGAIGDTDALGLDAAFPAVLLALVLPSLADRSVRNPALVGAVAAIAATPFLPAGLPVLLALAALVPAARAALRRTPARMPGPGTEPEADPEPGAGPLSGSRPAPVGEAR
ncbi:AzlC family ABC transporter permease [Kitasatospora sp. NPDC093679]|uniref:AzlC family ABC transporter permease n=1 Tax=Kitasatospora sp. NPDC093679 TaxID=3154983 RepID=UPI0034475ED0